MARVQGAMVVGVFEANPLTDPPFNVYEYIEGENLQTVLQGRAIGPVWSAALIRSLAEIVHGVHTLNGGVIHCDIKPSNILVSKEDGWLYLLDFGLAYIPGKPNPLPRHSNWGTPRYMPPEQASTDHAEPLPTGDQYSIGVMLYELLCGRPPFEGTTGDVEYAPETRI